MHTTSGTSPATAPRANSVRKALFAFLRLAIGVAILVYLVQSGRVNLHSLTRVFRAWPLTLLGMTVLLVDILFMSIRVAAVSRAALVAQPLEWNPIDAHRLLLLNVPAGGCWRRSRQAVLRHA